MLDEVAEKFELARGQLDRLTCLRDLGFAEVDRDVAEAKCFSDGGRTRYRRRASPQQCLDTREQLHHLERLDEVVVGAELQSDDTIDNLPARGQHQDRRLDSALAKCAAHIEATAAWQHDVEQDGVERAGATASKSPDGVAFALDFIA